MEVSSIFSVSLCLIILWLMVACCWNIRWRNFTILPPMYPGGLPVIGHTLAIFMYGRDLWVFVKNSMLFALNNGKEACTIVLGRYTLHVLTNPEDCNTIANTCMEKNGFYKHGKVLLGEGLLTGSESVWKQHRRLLNPALNQKVLDGFLGVFNTESKKLANSFKDKVGKESFDHMPYVQKWSLVSICSTAMGFHDHESNLDILNEFMSLLHILINFVVQRLRKVWLHSDYLFKWSSLKRQQDKILNGLSKLSDKVIAETEIKIKNQLNDISNNRAEPKFKAYIEILIELKLKNIFTNKEVKEEVDTMIAAGYETTFLTVTQILIVLGSYPDVQEKVYKELLKIFGGADREVLKEDLSQMMYLEAVIKETLRLYPAVPLILRHIDKDTRIRNYTLPTGHDAIIPIYALNRHSVWGPDAEVFRPERWLDPKALPDKAFASFSLGRRNCIGMNYAMMSMKTALAHILRQYKISADVDKVKYELLITMVPVSGHHIRVEKR